MSEGTRNELSEVNFAIKSSPEGTPFPSTHRRVLFANNPILQLRESLVGFVKKSLSERAPTQHHQSSETMDRRTFLGKMGVAAAVGTIAVTAPQLIEGSPVGPKKVSAQEAGTETVAAQIPIAATEPDQSFQSLRSFKVNLTINTPPEEDHAFAPYFKFDIGDHFDQSKLDESDSVISLDDGSTRYGYYNALPRYPGPRGIPPLTTVDVTPDDRVKRQMVYAGTINAVHPFYANYTSEKYWPKTPNYTIRGPKYLGQNITETDVYNDQGFAVTRDKNGRLVHFIYQFNEGEMADPESFYTQWDSSLDRGVDE